MTLTEACNRALQMRDLWDMDIHVLRNAVGDYYTVLGINLSTFLNSRINIDKTVYYTAWKLKK